MLLGDESVGPISDIDFLQLIQRGEIDRETLVRSVQFTSNKEVSAGKLNLQLIRELQLQRLAEEQRVAKQANRLTDQQNKNRLILRNGVKQAIADGRITTKERTQLVEFAVKTGIPKSVLTGECELNEKQLVVNGKFASKKFALNSIADAQWFSDGLFCRRSTGKSLFIRPAKSGLDWCKFAMLLQSIVTKQPVLGVLPEDNFIPTSTDALVAEPDETNAASDSGSDVSPNDSWRPSNRHPRYTFRVVGEQYDNRYENLLRLRCGDTVFLQPEPNNPYDRQAVAIVDKSKNPLGYLKREVSEWFEPVLQRGKKYQCEVFRKLESGGIVIAIYE